MLKDRDPAIVAIDEALQRALRTSGLTAQQIEKSYGEAVKRSLWGKTAPRYIGISTAIRALRKLGYRIDVTITKEVCDERNTTS